MGDLTILELDLGQWGGVCGAVDKIHDLCFKCERKDQIWRPITHQTVVAHHVANAQIMAEVHANISARCDAACVKKELPFEVESLRDLCSRGAIRTVYSKCAMVK